MYNPIVNIRARIRRLLPCSALFFPGLGQIYKGQPVNGIAWVMAVFVGYFFFVLPGLVLHLLCIIFAASGDRYR